MLFSARSGFGQNYQMGNTTISEYGTSGLLNGKSGATFSSSLITICPPVAGKTGSANYSTTFGPWSFYNREPLAPTFNASKGDYSDQILLSWQTDPLNPPCNDSWKIFRGNLVIVRPTLADTSYSDLQITAGQEYTYHIQGTNFYGLGDLGSSIGFVNPNGVITGRITTPHNNPVTDVEVTLTPAHGNALLFDGNDDYIKIPYKNALTLTSQATWEFWVKLSELDNQMFISQYTSYKQDGYYINFYDNKIFFNQGNNGALLQTSSIPDTVTANAWHHIAIVKNSATVTIYLDGNNVTATTANHIDIVSTTGGVWLGNTSTYSEPLHGILDEVRIWNVARDSVSLARNRNRVVESAVPNLLACWRLDEGFETRIFDLTGHNLDGDLLNGPAWSNDHADLHISAFTDRNGNYEISSIYYGDGTTFAVTPTKFGHLQWDPPSKNVTLNVSATSADQINFMDESMIPVDGFVRFQGTECYVPNVEIMNYTETGDTVSLTPPMFTDTNGHFTIDFEPGTSHQLIPVFKDHTFSPTFIDVDNITEPRNLGFINDTKLRTLNKSVVGGRCEFPIGTADVNIRTINDCFDTTVTTYSNGRISVNNLPAAEFEVIVNALNDNAPPDDISAGIQVSLIDSSASVKFTHYEHVQAEVIWPILSHKSCESNPDISFRVINQGDTVNIVIAVFRDYGNSYRCYLDSGSVTITDNIANSGAKTTLYISCPDTVEPSVDTMPNYNLIPGLPNILSGGDHPFQKNITIVAADTGGQNISITEWAYVLGHKPRGEFFTTSTPELPLHILHDPPGDKSYVELDQETVLTSTWSFDGSVSAGDKTFFKFKTGLKETVGFGVATDIKAQAINNLTWSVNFQVDHGHSWTTSITNSEVFTTSSSSEIVGDEGDVFIGAALNVIYGVTDVLEWDDENCTVAQDTSIVIAPNNFDTFYLYTESHVKNTVIPQLLNDIHDTTSADLWQQILDMNKHNRSHAQFDKNISFTSGAHYSSTEKYTTNHQWKLNSKLSVNKTVLESIDVSGGGTGSDIGTEINFGITVGGGYSSSSSQTTVTKYVLDDDDLGDYFSVDVLTDSLYGTPVFHTRAGASMCPWEPHTASREAVRLQMDSYEATNIPQTAKAVFTLNVGNLSQTEEEMTYGIRAIPESNPHGAVLQIDGQTLANAIIPIQVAAGEQKELTLTVARGPLTNHYEDMQIMFFSTCAYQHQVSTGHPIPADSVVLADTATFTVRFEELCESNITISYPADGWLLNQEDGDSLSLTVAGYTKNDPNFAVVYLEYAHDQGSLYGAEWFISDTISIDTIQSVATNYIPWLWNVSTVNDGPYWIRVKSQCSDGSFTYSDALHGVIDRDYPTVYSLPEPRDGVLGSDDEISVRFTKPLNCYQTSPDNFELFDVTRNINVLIRRPIDCNGYTITMTPNEQNYFLENHTLRATVKDIVTNEGESLLKPVSWEFTVDRNPVHWNQTTLDSIVYLNEKLTLSTTLRNTGANAAEFSFTGKPWWMSTPHAATPLPWWLDVSPAQGVLEPGGEVDIRFTMSGFINVGIYEETIYAHTPEGDEPVSIAIRALQRPPEWPLDENAFQYNMSMTAQISVKDTISTDPYDRIGAFVGAECRGIANISSIHAESVSGEPAMHEVFMTVHSNAQSGEQVKFRVWDASDAKEYWEINQHVNFVNNAVVGSVVQPLILNATGAIAQFRELHEGWTWFSVNLTHNDENMNINNVLSNENHFQNGDRIVHKYQFESYSEATGQWKPGTLILNPVTMYKAHIDTGTLATIIGSEIQPDSLPITVYPGENWLGYPLRKIEHINHALQNLPAADNSLIKDETLFSEYVADLDQWIGSLQWMTPGHGYILMSTSVDTIAFTYIGDQTEGEVLAKSHAASAAAEPIANLPWHVECANFIYNMPVILELNDAELLTENLAIAAVLNNEIRGVALPQYIPELEKYQIYLMTYSNKPDGETMSFELLDSKTGQMFKANESVVFNRQTMAGSIAQPVTLTRRDPLDIPKTFSLQQNYPNPFNPTTVLSYGVPASTYVGITVYDILGRRVTTLVAAKAEAGYHKIVWHGADDYGHPLASGMYFVRMQAGPFIQIRKAVLLK
ncbi:T9SS type A sorting domain-containing protein [candidate division KSB1 bacterium]|nr:T9SS type A sorting domain-containing protein [candidate division KSB1 bacterium]